MRDFSVLWLKDELGSCPLGCLMLTPKQTSHNHCLFSLCETRVIMHSVVKQPTCFCRDACIQQVQHVVFYTTHTTTLQPTLKSYTVHFVVKTNIASSINVIPETCNMIEEFPWQEVIQHTTSRCILQQ